MPYIPPPYPSSRRCNCGADVPLRFVLSTNPRNAGRPYYVCNQCKVWYRWGDGLGNSPRNSPTTSPAIAQGGFLPPPQAAVASQPSGVTDSEQCRYTSCAVKRVGRKCQRQMCRKHCRIAGGCTADGHAISGSNSSGPSYSDARIASMSLSPFSSTPRPDPPPPSLPFTVDSPLQSSSSIDVPSSSSSSSSSFSSLNIDPVLHQPSSVSSTPLPVPAVPRVQMADASINPRHASQLRPIFVEHVAGVHERAEKKRQRDQESVLDKKRMRERVLVFSFCKNDEDPVTVDVQDGFVYPYFKLTRSILLDLELVTPEDNAMASPVVHFFDPMLNTWVKMKMDSVIELIKPSQKLFFKAIGVTSYPKFDQHFQVTQTSRVPNPRVSLSQERSYVKTTRGIMEASVDAIDLELSSDEGSSDSYKRHHTTPQTTRSTPALSLDFQSRQADLSDIDEVISLDDDDDSITDIEPTSALVTARLVPGTSQPKFPSTFYTIDVSRAFNFIPRNGLTVEAQFERFFNLPYKPSTFYEHKARWTGGPQDAKDRAIAAGYSDAGRYRVFLDAHPAKNAKVKAERRKQRALEKGKQVTI